MGKWRHEDPCLELFPEQTLAVAVLLQAVEDAQPLPARGRRTYCMNGRLAEDDGRFIDAHLDAIAFLQDLERLGPYVELLGLDPEAVQRGLLRLAGLRPRGAVGLDGPRPLTRRRGEAGQRTGAVHEEARHAAAE